MSRNTFPKNFPIILFSWSVILLITTLVGCISAPITDEITVAPTSVPSLMPTETIVWFPPTEIPTALPTIVPIPTVDMRPGQGVIIFEDLFDSEGEWSLVRGSAGSAQVVNGHLTLALAVPKTFMFTTRQAPVFDNFYLEITANPSLCRGADEYGLLLRVTVNLEYYRFSLSCDGRARVDRYYNGRVTTVAAWTPNGKIPTGFPSSVRLGVWAINEDLRFFVDDQFLFSVRDILLYRGTVGAFVRTAGDTPVTVGFTELVVRSLNE